MVVLQVLSLLKDQTENDLSLSRLEQSEQRHEKTMHGAAFHA